MTMNKMESNREKVRRLLRELFQFDAQDLDFGIYRILNFRRKEIERFIEEDLIKAVEAEFKEYAKAGMVELQGEVEKLKTEINRDFGEGTIDEQGRVRKHEDTPKIKDYVKKVEELRGAEISEVQMNEVFNHVYEFFSRYYDKGDFISKRRFGGREKYYVPYNGEEVVLHWANKDQYYVKTAEYFRNYSFKAGNYRVNFLLREVEEEVNNVVGENKYFVLCDSDAVKIDDEKRVVEVHFEYRALTDEEKKRLGTRNVQEALVLAAVDKIFSETSGSRVVSELRVKVDEEKTALEKHLTGYVRRNTTDYFIHKNLKAFLERELEFYIKNEVVDLDELENLDERGVRIARAKVKAIREISRRIIEFLAQIEDFQKVLFEKKKFVIGTEYVITLDRIKEYVGEEFLESIVDEILENAKQLEEWKELLDIEVKNKKDLIEKQTIDGKDWKKLPIDTRHFRQEIKARLLDELCKHNDLDEILDGILIKSENFQALRLLLQKYKERVKCIYIDPPYNTGNDEFLYKDNYQHSNWIAMMSDRLRLAFDLLYLSGTIGVSIDNNELDELLKVLDLIFRNRRAIVTVKRGSVTGPKVINPGVVNVSEYLVVYSKSDTDWQPNKVYRERKRDTRYNSYIINRDKDTSQWKFISLLQAFADFKGIPRNRITKVLGKEFTKQLDQFVFDHANAVARTAALDDDKISKDARELKRKSKEDPETIYHFQRQKFEDWYIVRGERILFYSDRVVRIGDRVVQGELVTDIWDDTLPNDLHNEGGVTLKKGKKPEKLVGRLIELATNPGDLVLDFFVGTGTACAAAQKMRRKWIGVDMADFFDLLLVRRLKKTLNGEQSGISSATSWRGGGFFKYQTLEQYEDTLSNIVFMEKDKMIQETLDEFGDYLLRYMLEFETRNSPTRLNMEKFQTPFDYKITVTTSGEKRLATVDLIETFNYLLGINVEKSRLFNDGEREYRYILGKRREEDIAIIWRNTANVDLKRDKEFVENTILTGTKPDRIFINGDSLIEKAEPIEPEFKRLMGA